MLEIAYTHLEIDNIDEDKHQYNTLRNSNTLKIYLQPIYLNIGRWGNLFAADLSKHWKMGKDAIN